MVRKVGKTKRRRRVSGVAKVGAKHRTTRRRRRRISGTGDIMGMVEKAGGLVLGAVAARELNTIVSGMFTPPNSLSPAMSGLGQMVIGLFLPKFIKGSFVQAVGDGMVANGGMVLAVSAKVINGPSDRIAYRVNGTTNLRVVNGTTNLKVIGNAVNGFETRISSNPTNVPQVKWKNHV